MEFTKIARLLDSLGNTTKRLEKTRIISDFLKTVPPSDLLYVISLLQGYVFANYDERKLGFSSQYMIKAILKLSGHSVQQIKKDFAHTGDLGITAQHLIKKGGQRTIFSRPLMVKYVVTHMQSLAYCTGAGSVEMKVGVIANLLSQARENEIKYIVKLALEEMRTGVGDSTIRDSLIMAFLPAIEGITCDEGQDVPFEILKTLERGELDRIRCISGGRGMYNRIVELVQHALDLSNDAGHVAAILKEKGLKGLSEFELRIGKPVNVMLAPKENSVKDALKRTGIPAAIEYKLDGFRVQIHKGGLVRLFTRRLENVTVQFPDVVKAVIENVNGDCILDAEIVGVDTHTKKFVPFQKISQRIKRKHDIDELVKKLPVVIEVFDVLHHNGKDTFNMPFNQRRKLLAKILNEKENIHLVKENIIYDEKEGEEFYNSTLSKGMEGVMVKKLDGYYQPGKRIGSWVKVKPTMETLDLVIVGAEWGEGRRARWLSSFVVACRGDEGFEEIGKVSTGLKEVDTEGTTFEHITQILKPFIKTDKGKTVIIEPNILIEVAFEEIQKSPKYSSGYALRFPRFIRLRDDKSVKDASEKEIIEEMYKKQRGN